MALFGSERDISMFRHVNRELLRNVISQQCVYYKYNIEKTKVNIYGEADGGRFFKEPVIFNVLIERNDQEYKVDDGFGVDFKRNVNFAFLRDDLVDAKVFPEIGDIIMYNESYYEVDENINNQLFVGKDPQYPYDTNPYNPGLEKYGYNVSIIVKTHYTSPDKLEIVPTRL